MGGAAGRRFGAPSPGGLGDLVGRLDGPGRRRRRSCARRAGTVVGRTGRASRHARLVEPSTRDILALEEVAARGWQAGRGRVRPTAGCCGPNAGSATARTQRWPCTIRNRTWRARWPAARAWYADRGLPVILATPLPPRRSLDGALERLGLADHERGRRHGRADHSSCPAPVAAAVASVRVTGEPDERWLAAYEHPTASSARPSPGPCWPATTESAFASVEVDGQLGRDRARSRRRRLAGAERVRGRAAVSAAGAGPGDAGRRWPQWAIRTRRRAGLPAGRAGQRGAIALYRRLGFWRHHSYVYRREPKA